MIANWSQFAVNTSLKIEYKKTEFGVSHILDTSVEVAIISTAVCTFRSRLLRYRRSNVDARWGSNEVWGTLALWKFQLWEQSYENKVGLKDHEMKVCSENIGSTICQMLYKCPIQRQEIVELEIFVTLSLARFFLKPRRFNYFFFRDLNKFLMCPILSSIR